VCFCTLVRLSDVIKLWYNSPKIPDGTRTQEVVQGLQIAACACHETKGPKKMKLSVACNFDEALLKGLAGYPVYEVYGKLTTDYFGGGRPAFYLPQVNRGVLERTVKTAHANGIQFNYLLNASAMGNTEFTRVGQRKMDEMLDWLDGSGIDSITVANVYFLRPSACASARTVSRIRRARCASGWTTALTSSWFPRWACTASSRP
jgi:hypothetical protein